MSLHEVHCPRDRLPWYSWKQEEECGSNKLCLCPLLHHTSPHTYHLQQQPFTKPQSSVTQGLSWVHCSGSDKAKSAWSAELASRLRVSTLSTSVTFHYMWQTQSWVNLFPLVSVFGDISLQMLSIFLPSHSGFQIKYSYT